MLGKDAVNLRCHCSGGPGLLVGEGLSEDGVRAAQWGVLAVEEEVERSQNKACLMTEISTIKSSRDRVGRFRFGYDVGQGLAALKPFCAG